MVLSFIVVPPQQVYEGVRILKYYVVFDYFSYQNVTCSQAIEEIFNGGILEVDFFSVDFSAFLDF